MALEFTDANFETSVLKSDKLTVVDFWAKWCAPCLVIGPIIDQLSKDYDGNVHIGKVNIDQNRAISRTYEIQSIPTILFFKNGRVVDKHIGLVGRDVLERKIQSHL